MSVMGLDLNATRARAVLGSAGSYPLPVPLEPPLAELPMALSLENRVPEIGSAGIRLSRLKAHLVGQNFLPHLGENGHAAKIWQAGRTRLDAGQILQLVWKHLVPIGQKNRGLILTLPSYLSNHQAGLIRSMGEKAKLPVHGSVASPLAAALVGYAEQAWFSTVIVIDVDDHALTLAWVKVIDEQAHLLEVRHFASLGLRLWKERLLNALSDVCVWQTRRDPRDSPQAEQRLWEQLDPLLEGAAQGRVIQVGIQGAQWYQNLLVQPEQTLHYCSHMLRQLLIEIDRMLSAQWLEESPVAFLLTNAAGKIPGLASLLRQIVEDYAQSASGGVRKKRTTLDDFGEDLIHGFSQINPGVVILSPEALARSAHALASHFKAEFRRTHLDLVAPLPMLQPVEAGPARLHYEGQDYYLQEPHFYLGSQVGCHLVFDASRHPEVATRHCEIRYDQRGFLLLAGRRQDTLVNDLVVSGSTHLRPGDWIRLGTAGPIVRFLGQHHDREKLTTTA